MDNTPNLSRLFQTAGAQKQQQGTGYTNLNRVLQANAGNKLGEKVAGDVSGRIGNVQTQLGQQQTQFQTDAEKNRLGKDEDVANRESIIGRFSAPTITPGQPASDNVNPKEGNNGDFDSGRSDNFNQSGSAAVAPAPAPEPELGASDISAFEKYRAGQYTGPSGLKDTTSLAGTAGQIRNSVSNLNPYNTQDLIKQSVGGDHYNQGQQRLDSLLFNKGALTPVQRQAAGLGQQISRADLAASGTAETNKNLAQQFSKDTMNRLAESRQPLSGEVDTQLAQAQAQEAARLGDFSKLQKLLQNQEPTVPGAPGAVGSEVSGTSDLQVSPEDRIKQALGMLGTSADQQKELIGDQTKAKGFKDLASQLNDVNNMVNTGQVTQAQADQIKALFARIGETGGAGEGLKSFGSLNDIVNPDTQEKSMSLQYDRAGANQTYQDLLNKSRAETGLVGRAKEQNLDYMKLLNERLTNQTAQNVGRTGVASDAQAGRLNALDTLAGKSPDLLEFQKNRDKYAAGKTGLDEDSFKKYVEAGETGPGSLATPTVAPGTKDPTLEQALMNGFSPITGLYDSENPILGTAFNTAALPVTVPLSLIKNAPDIIGGAASSIGSVISSIFCFTGDTDIMMHNGSYKKLKDIKVNDKVAMGGKVKAVGQGLIKDLYTYKGFKVSGHHAVFDNGKWSRVEESNGAVPIGKEKESLVYPIVTETHLMVTKAQGKLLVSADMEEVDDTYNIKDDDIIKKLNSDSFKNKKIARFLAQYENRKL